MRFGYREVCLEHDTGARHPETADRLRAIRRGLARRHGVEYRAGEPADRETVETVHDPEYVASVESFCADGGGAWDADTVAVEETWDAALASAGLACWAVEDALAGADGRRTPFSIGRPPGHHAEPDEAMGFCFFNNAAVAVQRALESDAGGPDAGGPNGGASDAGGPDGGAAAGGAPDPDRAVVFDWDVHHGNGTQEIFYDRDDVLYVSVHERGLFPGTGAVEETGGPNAPGTTVNAPLPGGSGDAEYAAAVDELLDPAVDGFDPDLFVVSAGFDSHTHDPISRMRVSTEGFGHLTARVREIAGRHDAPLAFVLEGGYGLDALAESVAMVHEVFDGREPLVPEGDVSAKAGRVIDDARDAHGL